MESSKCLMKIQMLRVSLVNILSLTYSNLYGHIFPESEQCSDDNDADYNFSADKNARKGKKLAKKRKNNMIDTSRSKIHKASDHSSSSKSNTTSVKTTVKLADTSSFFYKFICEWYASAAQYGVASVMSKPIKCKRKFNNLKEAIDHLQTHHIGKLVQNDEPFKCSWQDCGCEEFSDEESIKEHVVCHAKGKTIGLVISPIKHSLFCENDIDIEQCSSSLINNVAVDVVLLGIVSNKYLTKMSLIHCEGIIQCELRSRSS